MEPLNQASVRPDPFPTRCLYLLLAPVSPPFPSFPPADRNKSHIRTLLPSPPAISRQVQEERRFSNGTLRPVLLFLQTWYARWSLRPFSLLSLNSPAPATEACLLSPSAVSYRDQGASLRGPRSEGRLWRAWRWAEPKWRRRAESLPAVSGRQEFAVGVREGDCLLRCAGWSFSCCYLRYAIVLSPKTFLPVFLLPILLKSSSKAGRPHTKFFFSIELEILYQKASVFSP